MASVGDFYKKIYATGEAALTEQENAIKTQAENAIKAQTDAYNQQIADVKTGYEDAFKKNETQRVLNERYLERKAAELGLTDSGMNRTQLTANELSFANQQGALTAAEQKDINTLAAAMRAKISEIETTRDTDIANLKANYDANVRAQAVDMYNNQVKSYGSGGGNNSGYTDAERKSALANLTTFMQGNEDADTKLGQLYQFMVDYDATELEVRNLLGQAGLSYDDYVLFAQSYQDTGSGSLRVSPQEYNRLLIDDKVNNAYVDPNDWNYKTNGILRYHFVITKATNNWFGGIDNNDRVTIYYPDNSTIVFKDIKISDLPVSDTVKQKITDKTAGKSTNDTFYYSLDFMEK